MSYWSLEIETPNELSDWLSWLIAEHLEVAVEIQDQETLTRGPDSDTCLLIVRTETEPDTQWVQEVKNCLHEVGCRDAPIRSKHESDSSWMLGWRAFFKPTEVAPGITVRPPWSEQSEREFDVVIDPGLAFGTGTHSTTQLAASLVVSVLRSHPPTIVLDQGCGSGILSLICAHFGHQVTGVEIDPVAVRNAQANLPLNSFPDGQVTIQQGDSLPSGDFHVIIMNIIAPVLIELAPEVSKSTAQTLILSGLLVEQEKNVCKAYVGWKPIQRETRGEWVGLVLTRTQ